MRTVTLFIALVAGMSRGQLKYSDPSRHAALPRDAVKVLPADDRHPPLLHSDEFEAPVPLPEPVNTAGAEDSAFVSEDGRTLWFWFTPDVEVPPERQIRDGVTGIWVTNRSRQGWTQPRRVVLQDKGKLALDGAPCVQGDTLWFCSAREGNYRGVDIWTARRRNREWADWRNAGARLNKEMQVGEVHVTRDGRQMYFHAERQGGKGGLDLWHTRRVADDWSEPENVAEVNKADHEGWPFLTHDMRELWFTRIYRGSPAIYRSRREHGRWSLPQRVASQFAAEPTLDRAGNLYFIHHYFKDGRMLESDIYLASRRRGR